MKRTLTPFIVLAFCVSMTSLAQIPNPGFEDWTAGDPDGWVTSNVFDINLIPVTQTSDKHTGASALRGDVVNFMGTPMGPIIQSGPGGTGFAISEKYNSIAMFYKFTPVGGDKFSVNVALTLAGNAIAQGAVALTAQVDTYTYLSVPLSYTVNEVPDGAIIQISITGPVTGSDYHVGSVMYVDDLAFSMSTGTGSLSGPDRAVNCYPNPAAEVINIPVGETASGTVTLTVSDACGKEIKKITAHLTPGGGNVLQVPVQDLSPGLYFYSVYVQNGRCQGKFMVSR